MAVGNYSISFGGEPYYTLANIWNGRGWQLVRTTDPGLDSDLTAVSCLPRTGCMAVGSNIDAAGTGHNLAGRINHGT